MVDRNRSPILNKNRVNSRVLEQLELWIMRSGVWD